MYLAGSASINNPSRPNPKADPQQYNKTDNDMQNINPHQAFYKRLKELILEYNIKFNITSNSSGDDPEDLDSYYAGVIAGFREVDCYLSNNEPWSREVLILELVVEKRAIINMRQANKHIQGFNMVYSEGQEKAMDIIQNEVYLFFPYFTRNIVVCKNA